MKHILAMLLALLGASGALAQIYVKVVPEKKTFLSGEAMYMRLTITNNSGVPVELKSREYSSWLDIHVEHSCGGGTPPVQVCPVSASQGSGRHERFPQD